MFNIMHTKYTAMPAEFNSEKWRANGGIRALYWGRTGLSKFRYSGSNWCEV
jgi:hypothetical protein